jgi:hypothetical protein
MAGRSKKDGGDIGLLLLGLALVGIVLLTIAVYAFPIILLVCITCYEIWASRASNNFALSAEEAEELSDVARKFNTVSQRLDEINEEGSQLKQNADGMYHRGSKLGIALNRELEVLRPEQEDLVTRYTEIQQLPIGRLNEWIRLFSIRSGFRWTAFAYVAIGLSLYLLDPVWMRGLSKFIGQYMFLRFPGAGDILYGSVLIAALTSAALFPIIYYIRRSMHDRATDAIRQRLSESPDEDDPQASEEDSADEYDGSESESHEPDNAENEDKPWYEILGVSPTASSQEINVAYREQVKKCHPDLVAGLDPDFRTLADEKAKALNAARAEGLSRY